MLCADEKLVEVVCFGEGYDNPSDGKILRCVESVVVYEFQ